MFMPKEHQNVRGREMNGISCERRRNMVSVSGIGSGGDINEALPQSPHAGAEIQAMSTIPNANGFVHQISRHGSRLRQILLY